MGSRNSLCGSQIHYETPFRGYDPQIGRFHQIDPLAALSENFSTYAFCSNNPISFSDPFGLKGDTIINGIHLTDSEQRYGVTVTGVHKKNVTLVAFTGAIPSFEKVITNYPKALETIPKPGGGMEVKPLTEELAKKPWLARILSLKGLLLTGALLSPLEAGSAFESEIPRQLVYEGLRRLTEGKPPYQGPGNKRDNSNPHIVYVFYFTPAADDPNRSPILKYGISDLLRWDYDRPESQRLSMKATWGQSADYIVISVHANRDAALIEEKRKVFQHYDHWGRGPRAQRRPGR